MGGNPSEFFRIYISQLSSKQLGLSPAFVSQLGGKIPKNCTIKDLSGGIWPVKLKVAKAGLFVVASGWQEFASHHSLVDGDFLVFDYDGDSRFGVKIYGVNGLRRRKAPNGASASPEKKEQQQGTEAPSSSLPTGARSLGIRPSRNCKMRNLHLKRTSTSPGCHVHSSGKTKQCRSHAVRSKAAEEAMSSFTLSYPYFKIVMHPCQLVSNLSIPNKFVMDQIKPRMEHAEQWIKKLPETKLLTAESNGSWGVTLIVYSKHRFHGKLSAGWTKFVNDNCLEVGDECFFELVNNNPVTMKVSIFKHNH